MICDNKRRAGEQGQRGVSKHNKQTLSLNKKIQTNYFCLIIQASSHLRQL